MARSGWGRGTLARVAAPAFLLALESSAAQAGDEPNRLTFVDEGRALPRLVLQFEGFDAHHEGPPIAPGAHLVLPLDRAPSRRAPPPDPVVLSLGAGIRYVHLIMSGDHRSPFRFTPFPFAPFFGTSSTTVGGLRLRF
jgi:hypothetical protein